jgi:hypothetical protein
MKKIKKISSNNIKNIVKEHFLEDSLLPEHKIDTIIKEYLREREDFIGDDSPIKDEYEFSPKTSEALFDMVDGLNEMVGDLEVIKEKEGNVLVYHNSATREEYADEILEDIIQDLERVVDRISDLTEISDNEEYDIED